MKADPVRQRRLLDLQAIDTRLSQLAHARTHLPELAELADLVGSVDADAVIARMGYRHPAGAVRRLDDALLAIFGRRYVELTGNSHRVPLLTARLDKLL